MVFHRTSTAESQFRQQLQYGGATFAAASACLRRLKPHGEPREPVELRALVRGLAASVVVLWGLPRMRVSLTPTPAGEELRRHLSARVWGVPLHRIAQGVLEVPASEADYLRGRRHRRALRNNVRRALAAKIVCRPLASVHERRLITERLQARAPHFRDWDLRSFGRPGDQWWGAFDSADSPIGLAHVTVDRDWALLQSLICTDRATRYLLHARVVGALATAGVRYLCTNSRNSLLLAPNLQYFQHLLGYRAAHLSIGPAVAKRVGVGVAWAPAGGQGIRAASLTPAGDIHRAHDEDHRGEVKQALLNGGTAYVAEHDHTQLSGLEGALRPVGDAPPTTRPRSARR